MNSNNKIFQIIFSILIFGIAFLLLLCIGICSPKTVVIPAVVDAEGNPVPPPDMVMPADLSDCTPLSVKNPTLHALPRRLDYNKQLQSYIYYSRANENETDLFQLLTVSGLFILNILMVCTVVYMIESNPRTGDTSYPLRF